MEADTDSSGELGYLEAKEVEPGLTMELFEQWDTDSNGSLSEVELDAIANSCSGCFCPDNAKVLREYLADFFLFGIALSALLGLSTAPRKLNYR